MEIQEGEIVYCTVKNIQGTSVFLETKEGKEGVMNFSEVAPGRIRNIRDFVFPGKRIICKILKIDSLGMINFSLRRVTSKEKAEAEKKYEKEKDILKIFKLNVKDNSEEIIKKIEKENENLIDFFENAKNSPELLEKYISKTEVEDIIKILKNKKEKPKQIEKTFLLQCGGSIGILNLKKILSGFEQEIVYLSPGKFRIKKFGKDLKQIDNEIEKVLLVIEERAKKEKVFFKKLEK